MVNKSKGHSNQIWHLISGNSMVIYPDFELHIFQTQTFFIQLQTGFFYINFPPKNEMIRIHFWHLSMKMRHLCVNISNCMQRKRKKGKKMGVYRFISFHGVPKWQKHDKIAQPRDNISSYKTTLISATQPIIRFKTLAPKPKM